MIFMGGTVAVTVSFDMNFHDYILSIYYISHLYGGIPKTFIDQEQKKGMFTAVCSNGCVDTS